MEPNGPFMARGRNEMARISPGGSQRPGGLSAAALCDRLTHIEEDFDAGLAAARAHIQSCDEAFGQGHPGWDCMLPAGGGADAEGLVAHARSLAESAGCAAPCMTMGPQERRFVLAQYAPQA